MIKVLLNHFILSIYNSTTDIIDQEPVYDVVYDDVNDKIYDTFFPIQRDEVCFSKYRVTYSL